MKLSLTTTLLALLGVSTALDTSYQCSNKAPSVINAIGKFCQKQNIVVPSPYATGGGNGFAEKSTHISIAGTCSPAQWIPQEYCFSQFYQICANGNEHGTGAKYYGRNGCQRWLISNGE